MAEGGSPPLRDPGGLHMYNINGGSHKLAELVPQPSIGIGLSNSSVNELGMYSNNLSTVYQTETGLQNNSYLPVDRYNNQVGMYEELKQEPHQMHSQSYYTNVDNMTNANNLYEPASETTYSSTPDMYKTNTPSSSLGGYIEMLGNSDSMMIIKQEKPDYNEHIGMSTNNHSPEATYSPNTCVGDWNYYNNIPNNSYHDVNAPNVPGNYAMFNIPQSVASYNTPPPMYSGTEIPSPLPTNVDIHNQSKKITQTILGLDWNQENMYKSRLYSNIEVENNGRKRKGDNSGNKTVKSRRKKSNDLGNHSKTVASILMSDQKGSKGKKSTSKHTNVLDSGERNSLVSKLMDNLRTTVQFESFCLSFPRTKRKENAFRKKVLATINLVQSIGVKKICSSPFPVNYLMGATKLLASFNTALKNTGSKPAAGTEESEECNTESRTASVGQVEENLPHSIFWVFKIGEHLISANWEGQFVMAVNPVQDVLTVSFFQFQPNFSTEGIASLHQANLSKDLAKDILENMELFEISRQLRCDINLKKVVQLYLYMPYDEQNEGCLFLELSENPKYFQRWLHTSASDKNRWQERNSFFKEASEHSNSIICIGGLVTELNEVVALMLSNSSELKKIYEIGLNKALETVPSNGFTSDDKNNANGEDKKVVNKRSHKHSKCIRKLGSNVIKLRKEILEVLKTNNIKDFTDIQSSNLEIKEEGNVDVSLGIHFNDKVCSCLSDYVNYSCDSANELNSILQRKIQPRHHGFYENDFDLDKVPDGNIDDLTVGGLLSSRCSESVFYSFCTMELNQVGYDHHCSECRVCRTLHYWHCANCDRCSESRSICIYCGHVKDDQSRCVIKPLSVFRSQLVEGAVKVDDIKEQWLCELNLPDDDIILLNKSSAELDDTDTMETMEYNSSNAMIDQLGLLNPVGFLLGQPLAGASRRYRRYKGVSLGDKGPAKSGGQSTGSSCSLQ